MSTLSTQNIHVCFWSEIRKLLAGYPYLSGVTILEINISFFFIFLISIIEFAFP